MWSPTQGVCVPAGHFGDAAGDAALANVRVIFRRGSGCYGINGADTVTYDAALLSQSVGKPVRVQLTRKDEMAWENYGFAICHGRARGPRCAGEYHRLGPRSLVAGAWESPGLQHSGKCHYRPCLAGFQPEEFRARTPAPEPTSYGNNSNGVGLTWRAKCGGRCSWHGNDKVRAVTDSQHAVSVLDSFHCARRSGSKIRSLMNLSWTNLRHARRPIRSRSGCVI